MIEREVVRDRGRGRIIEIVRRGKKQRAKERRGER